MCHLQASNHKSTVLCFSRESWRVGKWNLHETIPKKIYSPLHTQHQLSFKYRPRPRPRPLEIESFPYQVSRTESTQTKISVDPSFTQQPSERGTKPLGKILSSSLPPHGNKSYHCHVLVQRHYMPTVWSCQQERLHLTMRQDPSTPPSPSASKGSPPRIRAPKVRD